VVIEERERRRGWQCPHIPIETDIYVQAQSWPKPSVPSSGPRCDEVGVRRLDPSRGSEIEEPGRILRGGYAQCIGYVIVLGELLKREGHDVRWVTMIADNHPRGRGPRLEDSHEVLLLRTGETEVLLDPTADTVIPHPLDEVLRHPSLALAKEHPDRRYQERGYNLYDTAFWYSRVARYAVRTDHRVAVTRWTPNPHR
jgi:hypothetical protein